MRDYWHLSLDSCNKKHEIYIKYVCYTYIKYLFQHIFQVVSYVDTSKIADKVCYAHSDPHMKTFDGK